MQYLDINMTEFKFTENKKKPLSVQTRHVNVQALDLSGSWQANTTNKKANVAVTGKKGAVKNVSASYDSGKGFRASVSKDLGATTFANISNQRGPNIFSASASRPKGGGTHYRLTYTRQLGRKK